MALVIAREQQIREMVVTTSFLYFNFLHFIYVPKKTHSNEIQQVKKSCEMYVGFL